MNRLERATLLRYCTKYGLDPQEIDSTLTYWENKKHLQEQYKMLCHSLDTFELARIESQWEEYLDHNFLEYYAACNIFGDTKSEEIGAPDTSPQQFSLRTMTAQTFSLHTLIEAKRLKCTSDACANGE